MTAIEHEMTDDKYEELLNEIYEPVSVCGYMHDQGTLLKEIDSIAFHCGKSEYSNIQWECSECGTIYDDKSDAEYCCSCSELVECEWCGNKFIADDEHLTEMSESTDFPNKIIDGGNEQEDTDDASSRFCSWKCWKADEDNLNSHLGDVTK